MRKRAKLALVLVLLAAGAALAFVGATPAAYRTVGDLAADPTSYAGRSVDVKANVLAGSVDRSNGTFAFAINDERATLPVVWDSMKPLPEHEAGGSIEGRTVVLRGTLAERDGRWVLLAEEMQVGCASKYEPAPAEPAEAAA